MKNVIQNSHGLFLANGKMVSLKSMSLRAGNEHPDRDHPLHVTTRDYFFEIIKGGEVVGNITVPTMRNGRLIEIKKDEMVIEGDHPAGVEGMAVCRSSDLNTMSAYLDNTVTSEKFRFWHSGGEGRPEFTIRCVGYKLLCKFNSGIEFNSDQLIKEE